MKEDVIIFFDYSLWLYLTEPADRSLVAKFVFPGEVQASLLAGDERLGPGIGGPVLHPVHDKELRPVVCLSSGLGACVYSSISPPKPDRLLHCLLKTRRTTRARKLANRQVESNNNIIDDSLYTNVEDCFSFNTTHLGSIYKLTHLPVNLLNLFFFF